MNVQISDLSRRMYNSLPKISPDALTSEKHWNIHPVWCTRNRDGQLMVRLYLGATVQFIGIGLNKTVSPFTASSTYSSYSDSSSIVTVLCSSWWQYNKAHYWWQNDKSPNLALLSDIWIWIQHSERTWSHKNREWSEIVCVVVWIWIGEKVLHVFASPLLSMFINSSVAHCQCIPTFSSYLYSHSFIVL